MVSIRHCRWLNFKGDFSAWYKQESRVVSPLLALKGDQYYEASLEMCWGTPGHPPLLWVHIFTYREAMNVQSHFLFVCTGISVLLLSQVVALLLQTGIEKV